jgi:hypothetical protein
VPQTPKAPWVNPDRKRHLLAAAIIAALVLVGAGFGIGYAAAPSGDHGDRIHRGYFPGERIGVAPGGRLPDGPFPHRFPNRGPASSSSSAPSATPSTPSSSASR